MASPQKVSAQHRCAQPRPRLSSGQQVKGNPGYHQLPRDPQPARSAQVELATSRGWPCAPAHRKPSLGHHFARRPCLAQCGLDIFQAELEGIGIKLFVFAAEEVAHEDVYDQLKLLKLRVGLALYDHHVGPFGGQLERKRTGRFHGCGLVRCREYGSGESIAESPFARR